MIAIDPDIQALLNTLGHLNQAVGALSTPQLRTQFDDVISFYRNGAPPLGVGVVRDDTVDTAEGPVSIRVYDPLDSDEHPDLVIFFHGGGWMTGNLETADRTARALTRGMHARVVSVDYRLAPEYPFPAGFDDGQAVVKAFAAMPHRWLGVAGDSAGGNLAATVAAISPQLIDGQLLIYPGLNPAHDHPSHSELAEGCGLTLDAVQYYWKTYRGDAAISDPRLSPASLGDLSGVPSAVVTTAGYDPLRDEGQEYAARLVTAGVQTTYLPMPHLVHGWIDMNERSPAAQTALNTVIANFAALRDATLGSSRLRSP